MEAIDCDALLLAPLLVALMRPRGVVGADERPGEPFVIVVILMVASPSTEECARSSEGFWISSAAAAE